MSLLELGVVILLAYKIIKLEKRVSKAQADCARCRLNIANNFVRKKGI